ncbi:helix-turn-helix transcriptional regulator [Paenibacillus arenilitoris]|uniref:WYL domain-containing protein n=1 Tax=Paenibacillus arenilitoris TaxID=2772299 RepID=A0A927CH18_9BACL|nr:WYL domain-containing protein [Paenibacillus arenilitoris]MBD2867354.1 WYL domain-containing protein [Paenibacillus arenilitoris]
MSKADNMLAILWLLQSGKRMTAKQLADELEIHVRTVYRCIDSLCASGAPIIADSGPNGGYRILGRFAESPLLFDMDEQKALVQASTFAREAGYPFTEALDRAIDKLKRYANEKQLGHMERHGEGISVIQPPVDDRVMSYLQILEEAAAQGRSLRMAYESAGADCPSDREFDPYGIIHWKGHWYTAGFCRYRGQPRSFRVDRIAGLSLMDRHFEKPAEFSAKQFLMGGLLPGATGESGLLTVRIRAAEQALNELCRHWMFGHAMKERKDGEATFELSGSSMRYVPYFLLPYGKALTILEPDELIGKMAEVSAGIAAHYDSMRSDHLT